MASGWFIGGPETKAFEQEYAAYCGTEYAVALGSGSAALNLTLKALGIGPGDEVITVAFTLSATLDAIVDLGATPVLVDVDPATYTMDAGSGRREGHAADEGHPAREHLRPPRGRRRDRRCRAAACPSSSTPASLTAPPTRASRRRPSAPQAASASTRPRTSTRSATPAASRPTTPPSPTASACCASTAGTAASTPPISALNSRMDEIHAAVLRTKLPHLDAWNKRRTEIARALRRSARGHSPSAPPPTPTGPSPATTSTSPHPRSRPPPRRIQGARHLHGRLLAGAAPPPARLRQPRLRPRQPPRHRSASATRSSPSRSSPR